MRANMLMRTKICAFRACVCLLLAAVPLGNARAESFFQKLFGWGKPAAPASQARPSRPVPSLGSFSRSGGVRYQSSSAGDDESDDGEDAGGTYKTMCVRTCDGYYFPVSPRASSRRFARDARRCQAMCGQDAKLFHLPRDSDDTQNMTDIDGRTYSALPQAFAYRRSLVNGCSCKPMPWSMAETARHSQYAMVETLIKSQERNAELARAEAAVKADAETLIAMTRASEKMTRASEDNASDFPEPSAPLTVAALSEPADNTGNAMEPPYDAMLGHLLPVSTQRALTQESSTSPRLRRAGYARGAKLAFARAKPSTVASFFSGAKFSWPGDARGRRR